MGEKTVLRIEDLTVRYHSSPNDAVYHISFALKAGESIGVIGESGSGKSTLLLSIMGLLRKNAQLSGRIYFGEDELTTLPEKELDLLRWKKIALVFQNSLDVVNPVLTIEEQILECIYRHMEISRERAASRTYELLDAVGLSREWAKAYPHQLSGGMRQKVLIAMALCCDPAILLVDEPTMALDAQAKQEMISLLSSLQSEKGFAMLVISHELPVVSQLTSRIMVMYAGSMIEEGPTAELLARPLHPYTRGLIYASPNINIYRDMWGIPGEMGISDEGCCPFHSRCVQCIAKCSAESPSYTVYDKRRVLCHRGGIITLLKGENIQKNYQVARRSITACGNCHIDIKAGEIVALIGESGSGKTTLAEILSGVLRPDAGKIVFAERSVCGNSETAKMYGMQIVFQDPFSAINEQMSILQIVREPLDVIREGDITERSCSVACALKSVQLPNDEEFLQRRGYTLSGGQRQRVAIARALVMKPKLLIADEISAMLDPSTGANILRLLKGLQNTLGFSMLFITHDLALALKISDRIFVMRNGEIIEQGTARQILLNPRENYTQRLVNSQRFSSLADI